MQSTTAMVRKVPSGWARAVLKVGGGHDVEATARRGGEGWAQAQAQISPFLAWPPPRLMPRAPKHMEWRQQRRIKQAGGQHLAWPPFPLAHAAPTHGSAGGLGAQEGSRRRMREGGEAKPQLRPSLNLPHIQQKDCDLTAPQILLLGP